MNLDVNATTQSRFVSSFLSCTSKPKNPLSPSSTQLNESCSGDTSDSSSGKVPLQGQWDINIDNIVSQEDIRSTLMIKNIPNKFTKDKLIKIINQYFRGAYDLFIMPTDSNASKNFGYAFINLINSLDIVHFYKVFNGKKWARTNSQKICEITYSKIQGTEKLKKHYPQKHIYENEYQSSNKQIKANPQAILTNGINVLFPYI